MQNSTTRMFANESMQITVTVSMCVYKVIRIVDSVFAWLHAHCAMHLLPRETSIRQLELGVDFNVEGACVVKYERLFLCLQINVVILFQFFPASSHSVCVWVSLV